MLRGGSTRSTAGARRCAGVGRRSALPGRIAAYLAIVADTRLRRLHSDSLLAGQTGRSASGACSRTGRGGRRATSRARCASGARLPRARLSSAAGHVIAARRHRFLRPDSDCTGAGAARELAALEAAIAVRETTTRPPRDDNVEAELNSQQEAYHGESLALSSQQRRCHDLELELSQLKQAADTADKRRAAIAEELSALSAEEAVEREARAAIDADLAADRRRLADAMRARDAGEAGRDEAELALAAARDRVHAAERATQEAGFAERSCRERLAEFSRRREDLQAQVAQQQALVGQLSTERAQIDWTPVEASLQEQLAARAAAEQALSAARDRQEALAAELRTGSALPSSTSRAGAREDRGHASEAAGAVERSQRPARGGAHADLAAPGLLKAWGRASLAARRDRAADANDRRAGAVGLPRSMSWSRPPKRWAIRRPGQT